MKTARIPYEYWSIVSTMSASDIANAHFGSCNLTSEYLNSYRACDTAEFIDGFIADHYPHASIFEYMAPEELAENPDYLLDFCANEYFSALAWLFDGDVSHAEDVIRSAKTYFEAWGDFYVYVHPVGAFIIRASSESDAYDALTQEFERFFECEDAEEINDNGTPVDTEELRLIGRIVGATKRG